MGAACDPASGAVRGTSRIEPRLSADSRDCIKVTIGRDHHSLHLARQRSEHDIYLREYAPGAAQFVIKFAKKNGRLSVERPDPNLLQELSKELFVVLSLDRQHDTGLKLAKHGYTGAHAFSAEQEIEQALANPRV